jgi:DNA (cytosine-5)-methyltransferase 1
MHNFLNHCSVVDLFCGIGGLTHGLQIEGFNVVAGIDIDKSCEFAYTNNNNSRFVAKDLRDIDIQEMRDFYGSCDIKVLVGCAPCQPFSALYANKRKESIKEDDKWYLLNKFAEFVEKLQPEIISMENVPQLTKQKIYEDFCSLLSKNGYNISSAIVNCADYGVAQKRKRLVLLASKLGKINLLAPTHLEKHRTIKDVIADLPQIEDGEICDTDKMHVAHKLSELNKKRILASKPGGSWKDWTEDLLLTCHKDPRGKKYTDVYGRMSWDLPAPTLTTKCTGIGNGRFGHPEQNRAISLREAAILQSFPLEYKFFPDNVEKIPMLQVAKQIGNAVPVELGRVIAKSIINHLKEFQQ